MLKTGRVSDLEVWNRLLAEVIKGIGNVRKTFTEEINIFLREHVTILGKRTFSINYTPSVEFEDKSVDWIFAFLMSKKERESRVGYVLYGPHRDNWDFIIQDGLKSKDIFSQGEYRLAFLELIFAANAYLKTRHTLIPVILLDDVFSELDSNYTNKLTDQLDKLENQIFITGIGQKKINKTSYYNIKDNSITAL